MYKRGIVSSRDAERHMARVTFPDAEGVESPWLDVLAHWTHADKAEDLPALGDQVAVMLDDKGESGCVLGGVYSSVDAPAVADLDVAAKTFGDGTRVSYNRATHVLTVDAAEGAHVTITGPALVTVDAEKVVVNVADVCELAGNASPIALATKVASELEGVQACLNELRGHTHDVSTIISGGSGSPVSGTMGGFSFGGYSPSPTGSAKVKSA